MSWVTAVEQLRRERRPGVVVTVAAVRGHAPREAGAKMVVAEDAAWESIGGGNLEATALARAREMLARQHGIPELLTLSLTDRAPAEHGVQCCGAKNSLLRGLRAGKITILLRGLKLTAA